MAKQCEYRIGGRGGPRCQNNAKSGNNGFCYLEAHYDSDQAHAKRARERAAVARTIAFHKGDEPADDGPVVSAKSLGLSGLLPAITSDDRETAEHALEEALELISREQ